MKRPIVCFIVCTYLITLYIWSRSNSGNNMQIQFHGRWMKHDENPVLGNVRSGTYFDPFVIERKNIFWMFFSDRTHASIALSHSFDGINWSNPIDVLRPDSHSGWEKAINRCCVVYHNFKYYMYYTGQENGESRIGVAISLDCIHFRRIRTKPILYPLYSYEGKSVMNPFVLYDEQDKCFKMWFSAGETSEPDVICYATSRDGIVWSRYNQNPIFSKGVEEYDQAKVSVGHVLKGSDGYTMFYISYENHSNASISVAYSKNGITGWSRSADNPMVIPTSNSWDQDSCYKPSVLYSRSKRQWLLWYNGRRASQEYIGLCVFTERM